MRRRAGVTAIGLIVPLLFASVLLFFAGPQADANDVTIDVAIDVDTAGNGDNVLGPTESCNEAPLAVGDTIDVDIVVRGIPEYAPNVLLTGLQGFDLDLIFDPTVVQVTKVHQFEGPTILKSAGLPPHFVYVDYNLHSDENPPGVTGDTSLGMVSLSDDFPSGNGVLTRVTIKGIGAGAGRLDLRYTEGGSETASLFDWDQQIYPVRESGATIAVGGASCSPPTPTTFPFVTETPGPTSATSPTPIPTAIPNPPTVQTAIDVDTTGNEDNSLGSTESCNETPLQVGDTIDVDVVVRGVPSFDRNVRYTGILGFELDLLFDPAILEVTKLLGMSGPTILKAGGSESAFVFLAYNYPQDETPPGVIGDSTVSITSLAATAQDGDGVLTRVTLKAVGPGASRLALQRTNTGTDTAGIFEPSGVNEYAVAESDAVIIVGAGDCSAPTPTPTPTPPHFTPTTAATLPPRGTPTYTVHQTASPTPTITAAGTPAPATVTPRLPPPTGGPPGSDPWGAAVLGAVIAFAAAAGALTVARRRL